MKEGCWRVGGVVFARYRAEMEGALQAYPFAKGPVRWRGVGVLGFGKDGSVGRQEVCYGCPLAQMRERFPQYLLCSGWLLCNGWGLVPEIDFLAPAM